MILFSRYESSGLCGHLGGCYNANCAYANKFNNNNDNNNQNDKFQKLISTCVVTGSEVCALSSSGANSLPVSGGAMSLTLVPSEVTASEVTVGSWVKVRAFSDWEQPLVVGANVDEVDNGMSATVHHKPAYQW